MKWHIDDKRKSQKHKQSYIDIIAEHCMESFEWANIYNVAAKKFTTMFTYIQVMGFLGLLAVLGKMIPGVLGLKIKHKAILSYLKKKYDTLGTETWYEFSRYYPIYTEVKHGKRT